MKNQMKNKNNQKQSNNNSISRYLQRQLAEKWKKIIHKNK
jgi:hypothetical protein